MDDEWDFFGHVTYIMLLDSTGKLGIAADFEAAVFPRFDDTVALDAQGAVAKFCRHLLNGIDKTDAALIADFMTQRISPPSCAPRHAACCRGQTHCAILTHLQ